MFVKRQGYSVFCILLLFNSDGEDHAQRAASPATDVFTLAQ
jgi:hypothetical protein